MLHKRRSLLSSENFNTYPETITFTGSGSVVINAIGYGLFAGTTGLRWWDSAVLPATTTVNGTAGTVVTLPFTKNFLSTFWVDLIGTVTINGIRYIYAASSSPDNAVVTTSNADVTLMWMDLKSFGINTGVGNNNAANNFMMGGFATNSNGTNPNKIFFSDPTTTSGTVNVVVTFVSYNGSTSSFPPYTVNVNYAAGVSTVDTFTPQNILSHYLPFLGGSGISPLSGYYKIQLSNANTNFKSALNFYHHGQSA